MRIKDLKDLQKKVFQIPDDSLVYHLSRNHFSRSSIPVPCFRRQRC